MAANCSNRNIRKLINVDIERKKNSQKAEFSHQLFINLLHLRHPLAIHAAQNIAAPQRMKMVRGVNTCSLPKKIDYLMSALLFFLRFSRGLLSYCLFSFLKEVYFHGSSNTFFQILVPPKLLKFI